MREPSAMRMRVSLNHGHWEPESMRMRLSNNHSKAEAVMDSFYSEGVVSGLAIDAPLNKTKGSNPGSTSKHVKPPSQSQSHFWTLCVPTLALAGRSEPPVRRTRKYTRLHPKAIPHPILLNWNYLSPNPTR